MATFAPYPIRHGVRMKHDSHLSQMIKEPYARIHPREGAKRRIKDNEKIRLSAGGNSIIAKVQLDERVADGTVVLPFGFEQQIPVHELGEEFDEWFY